MLNAISDRASSISVFIVMVVAIIVGMVLYLFDSKRHFENP